MRMDILKKTGVMAIEYGLIAALVSLAAIGTALVAGVGA